MQGGLITINTENRIINAKSSEEIPSIFNKGGMKKIFESIITPTIATNNKIALEGSTHGSLGPEGLVRITTLDLDNNILTDEIIDVEVNEKRKRDEIVRRRMRPRLDDEHIIPPAPRSDDRDATPANAIPATASASASVNVPPKMPEKVKKFRYASELNQTIDASTIGERIMDTVVELPIHQVLTVAPEVTGYIHGNGVSLSMHPLNLQRCN